MHLSSVQNVPSFLCLSHYKPSVKTTNSKEKRKKEQEITALCMKASARNAALFTTLNPVCVFQTTSLCSKPQIQKRKKDNNKKRTRNNCTVHEGICKECRPFHKFEQKHLCQDKSTLLSTHTNNPGGMMHSRQYNYVVSAN